MDMTLTSVEVLAIAIRSQQEAARQFGHISHLTANTKIRQKFRRLAREAVQHRRVLVRLFHKMAPCCELPRQRSGVSRLRSVNALPSGTAGAMESLLLTVISEAQTAEEFYRLALQSAADLSTKLVFQSLIHAVQEHTALLSQELELCAHDPQHYLGKCHPLRTKSAPQLRVVGTDLRTVSA